MINKGLLTKPKLMPFGNHKDPTPEVMPGRVDADSASQAMEPGNPSDFQTPTDTTGTQGKPQTDDALTPDSIGNASDLHQKESPIDTPRKRQNAGRTGRKAPTDRASSPQDRGGVRYKLQLRVDEPVLQSVEKYFAGLDDVQKIAAKQSMMRAFRKFLLENAPKKSTYSPSKPVVYRVDMMIPPSFQDKIMKVEEAGVFEAPTPVMSRNFSPLFAAFVKNTLGK